GRAVRGGAPDVRAADDWAGHRCRRAPARRQAPRLHQRERPQSTPSCSGSAFWIPPVRLTCGAPRCRRIGRSFNWTLVGVVPARAVKLVSPTRLAGQGVVEVDDTAVEAVLSEQLKLGANVVRQRALATTDDDRRVE